jgi:hypothetical protein
MNFELPGFYPPLYLSVSGFLGKQLSESGSDESAMTGIQQKISNFPGFNQKN